jgi:hypothetical protein
MWLEETWSHACDTTSANLLRMQCHIASIIERIVANMNDDRKLGRSNFNPALYHLTALFGCQRQSFAGGAAHKCSDDTVLM